MTKRKAIFTLHPGGGKSYQAGTDTRRVFESRRPAFTCDAKFREHLASVTEALQGAHQGLSDLDLADLLHAVGAAIRAKQASIRRRRYKRKPRTMPPGTYQTTVLSARHVGEGRMVVTLAAPTPVAIRCESCARSLKRKDQVCPGCGGRAEPC